LNKNGLVNNNNNNNNNNGCDKVAFCTCNSSQKKIYLVVGMVTRLWAKRPRNRGSIPDRCLRFLSLESSDLTRCPLSDLSLY